MHCGSLLLFLVYPPRRVFPSYLTAFSSQESFESWLIMYIFFCFFYICGCCGDWSWRFGQYGPFLADVLVLLHFFFAFSQNSSYEIFFIVQRIYMKTLGRPSRKPTTSIWRTGQHKQALVSKIPGKPTGVAVFHCISSFQTRLILAMFQIH